tara:strand:+ start:3845 stop:4012 length:168 start_codon:yes stop_codon:yes gene_type:complete
MTAKIVDEYEGQGGSYILDLKTGKRKLVEQTQSVEQPTDSAEQPTDSAIEELEDA